MYIYEFLNTIISLYLLNVCINFVIFVCECTFFILHDIILQHFSGYKEWKNIIAGNFKNKRTAVSEP